MKLRKDEARIFWAAIDEAKYNFINDFEKTKANLIIGELNKLQNCLMDHCIDNRRKGRNSHDSFNDLLTRYKFKNESSTK
jgi:hypothetical protein